MWVSEPFNMGYFYYPMILWWWWYFLYRFELFEKVSFVFSHCLFIYYLFLYLRAGGRTTVLFSGHWRGECSKEYFPSSAIISTIIRSCFPDRDTNMVSLVWRVRNKGERLTAFPSSHVGMSTILMIMAWRGSKRLFAGLLPFHLLLWATVYSGH